ncbi:hypothetical protein BDA96_03G276700 [Sorghum bicolor]|uniref:DUF2921 domain-containing protein n=1 Tax=Sorghum bicolor TaxID=4558 RepID=A0A921URB0_SORBI|nr:hypothetical protein BDA96_03G276700 [Sorghum bicolor]
MAPQPSKHGRCARQLIFFLPTLLLSSSTAALAAVVPTASYSSHCASPSPSPDRHADVSNDADLLSSFHLQPSTGFFSGRGADSLFSPNSCDGALHGARRSLSFHPRGVSRTADPTLLHLTATLTLFGCRAKTSDYEYDGRPENHRRNNRSSSSTVSFDLDGYYSTNSSELCVVGTGTEAAGDVRMTVHFASFGEAQGFGFGHGKGRISSLRDSTDDLYFETRDITIFGMCNGNQQQQVSASIWRTTDLERIVTVASVMLFCVFAGLWSLRASRNREEPPAMHVAVISLGCVALEFILSHWVFFLVTFVHMFS